MRAVLVFAVLAVLVFGIVRSNSDPGSVLGNETALNWTLRALGSLLAVTSAFAILVRGLASESLERQFGFVLPLLAGMLLVNNHWSLALSLGAVGVALIVKEIAARRQEGQAADAPPPQ